MKSWYQTGTRFDLYYLRAPKYAGGLDRRGRTPTKINRFADTLREEASPAKVLELNTVLCAGKVKNPVNWSQSYLMLV